MSPILRWVFGLTLFTLATAVPVAHFRAEYAHAKRLREVKPGVLYRSGQLTAEGLSAAISRFGIRTVVNLQDEYPDPVMQSRWLGPACVTEKTLCQQAGVRYVYIAPDLLPRRQVPPRRPEAVERFLTVMDDPASYPVLIHCRAGLHRTGVMAAVYRMEYEGWGAPEALEELRENGFGDWACSSANEYIKQYLLAYRPGVRQGPGLP